MVERLKQYEVRDKLIALLDEYRIAIEKDSIDYFKEKKMFKKRWAK